MDTLQKTYNSFSSGIDDEKLEKLVNISDIIMGPPAAMLLARAGIDASRSEPFRLLDNACATGTLGSRLQQIVDVNVLKKSSILCGDIVEPQLDIVKRRIERYEWVNTEVANIDAQVGSRRCRHALREKNLVYLGLQSAFSVFQSCYNPFGLTCHPRTRPRAQR